MTTLPIVNPKIAQAVAITGLMDSGTTLMVNPLLNPGNAYGEAAANLRGQSDGMQHGLAPSHPAYYLLGKVTTTLDGSTAQSQALMNHGNLLIFGDPRSSSIIGGGLQSNLGLAMGAITLDNTLNGAGAASGGGDPCALIGEMFNSILGLGEELLNTLMEALNNTPIAELINQVGNLINEAEDAVAAAISELMAQVEAGLSAVREAMDAIANQIAEELAKFGEWLSKSLNYIYSNFLSGLFDDPCFRLVIGAVGTAALIGALSQTPASTPRRARPRGLWSVPGGGGGWNVR